MSVRIDRHGASESLDEEIFAAAPRSYAPVPFWGLNDRLDPGLVREQVAAMSTAGWAGFFMHARHGLETAYLGADYLAAVAAAVDEAGRRQLSAWIYDEHPFPSGAAGGLVGAERRSFRHRVLAMNPHTRLTPLEEGVAYFQLELDQRGVPVGARRILDAEREARSGADGWYLHFYEWEMPAAHTPLANHGNRFLHGFPYTDVLNPQAVARFAELTYDRYREELGAGFADLVSGAFSDIPTYHWHYATPHPSLPWTPALPRKFVERYGYDLLDVLPSLMYELGEHRAVRHDFWKLASDLFVESYTKQLADWCRVNGIAYSAHYWGEEALHWQVAWAGDVMHHLAFQDVVANDHILRNIDDPLGIKQAASVAEQLRKPRMLTEIYALSGHNLTYAERKWIGDWAFALGSNLLVPYVPAYSLRGRRKRDEPPSLFVQQPYWPDERLINDYFARLGYALSSGRRVVDILLLQPLSSAWALYVPPWETPPAWRPAEDRFEGAGAELFALSDAFRNVVDWLLESQRDFHVGNEAILGEHGSISDGGALRVGDGSYTTVVVPPSISWSESTLELLRRFSECGGHIVAMAPLPECVDGRRVERHVLPDGARMIPCERQALLEAMPAQTVGVRLDAAPTVRYQQRRDERGDRDLYFLVNSDKDRDLGEVDVELVGLAADRAVQRWEPLDGTRTAVPATPTADGLRVRLPFPPTGSQLLVVGVGARDGREVAAPATPARRERLSLKLPWRVELHDPNALVLDNCSVQVGDEAFERTIPIWQAHELLRRAGTHTRFALRFAFRIDVVPARAALAIEQLDRYELRVNGCPVDATDAEPWWDPALSRVDVTDLLCRGENTAELGGVVGVDTEIEAIYLVGDFAVRVADRRHVVAEPIFETSTSDLTTAGLPFFVGRLTLANTFELTSARPAWLVVRDLHAVTARVRVNGADAGAFLWPPYRLDISPHVRRGSNDIEIELATSLHNLLGPHHNRHGEVRHFVIDGVWTDTTNWTDDYYSVPVGVVGAAVEVAGA